MSRLFRFFLCFCVIGTGPAFGDSVSRTLPAVYGQEIEPLLTPGEPLLKLSQAKDAEATGGEVLLREQIVWVDEAGGKVDTTHTLYRAVAESGLDALSRDVEPFHKKRTRIHLALARTLQPDGRDLPVRGEAAFIQTPQRSADSDLYDDQGEMVIIYPDVKKGSVAESIVVREERESRIPGHFTLARGFAGGWPALRDRFILDVPRALADRLKLTTLGSGVPEPRREELKDGQRIRWTWERQNIPGLRQEDGRVSMDQTGPVVFISTLPDWETFLAWYLPQAEKSMELSAALKTQIDGWTKDAKSPMETTAILLRKVASEVRYVGLEFGIGDLVPRAADATWENQYGDCKDKACLLTAMLRHKGIQACPALINTDFPGRVEKRSPDYRHFDHCITAVKGPEGTWIFCDPTIPGLLPGGIGPSDSDREVLLVQAGPVAEWARTPVHDFGLLRHRLDLRMDAAGALSGWAAIEAEGYNASRCAGREEKATAKSLLDSLQTQFNRLSEGLTAVDVKKYSRGEDGPYRVEAYILIPGNGAATLPFLADKGFVPQTGNEEERETPFASWKEIYEAEARITLPPGLIPASLPEALESTTVWADASGSWQWKDGVLTSKFRFHSKLPSIPPADFPAFCRQMRAVNAWLARALPLQPGGPGGTPAPAADDMETLPHLPTAEGQLLLVDNKYPLGGNAGLRRAALEKSLRYFPGNQSLLYRAGCSLAWLDITGGDPAAGLKRLDSFQESCRAHVDADEAALGDYFRAAALKDLDKKDGALTLYRKLAADPALHHFRRTWSFYQAVLLMEEPSPAEALALCQEGMTLQDVDSEAILYSPWARLLLKAGRSEEIETVLQKLAADRTQAAPAILTYLANQVPSLPAGQATALLERLERIGPPPTLGGDYAKALAEAKAAVVGGNTGDFIRDRLTAFLKEHPDTSESAALPEGVKTAAAMGEALEKLLEAPVKEVDPAIKLGIGSIRESGPGTPLGGALFNLLKVADLREKRAAENTPEKAAAGALLDELLAIAKALPREEDTHYEGLYLLAKLQQRRGQKELMKATAMELMAGTDPERTWIAIAPLKLLLNEAAEAGDLPEVLQWCAEMRKYPEAAFAADALFHEAAVSILNGDYPKALALLDELSAKSDSLRKSMTLHEQAESLLTFVQTDRDAAVKWWKDSAGWWPATLAAVRKIHPEADSNALPLIPDTATAARNAGVAAGGKNFSAVAAYLLRLTGAARFDPAFFAAYAGICSQPANMGMDFAAGPLSQSVCAVEPCIPAGSGHTLLWIYVEEAWCREKNWSKTAAAAQRYFSLTEKLDRLSGFAVRYWAVAADETKRDYAEIIAVFKKILETDADPTERPRNLWLCAHLLTLDGKRNEARLLLQTELQDGKLDVEHPMMGQLRAMKDNIDRETTMTGKEISGARAAVDHWMKTAAPAWFDWMSPASLEAPELKDLKKWLAANTSQRPAAAMKVAVMILRDPAQPSTVREEAITTFLSTAPWLAADPQHRHAAWEAVFKTDGLPEETRSFWLAFHLFNFASHQWLVSVKPWLSHPLLEKAPETLRPRLARTRQLSESGLNHPDKTKELALSILADHPDDNALRDFATALEFLVYSDPASAAVCLEALGKTDLPPDCGTLKENLILETTRQLAAARELAPVHAALLTAFRRHFSQEVPRPDEADLLAGEQSGVAAGLDAQKRFAILRWQLQNGTFARHSLEIWEQLVLCLDRYHQDAPAAADLAVAALTAAEGDEAAVAAIGFADYCLDIDDEAQRGQFADLLKPLAAKTEWTDTADWLVFLEARTMLRTGTGTDASAAIETLGDRVLKNQLIRMQLGTLMAHDQKPRLKKFLASTPSVLLLSPACLPVTLPAWRHLGMKEEASLAETRNKTALRSLLETAWPAHDVQDMLYSLHWMMETGDASLIPPGLEEDLPRWMGNPVELNDAQFTLASLREDWETAAQRGIKAIEDQPSRYSAYVHAAKACAKTKRFEEARRYLTIYLEKTHNEVAVPEAKALLATLPP